MEPVNVMVIMKGLIAVKEGVLITVLTQLQKQQLIASMTTLTIIANAMSGLKEEEMTVVLSFV